ncbi:MAG: alpha-ketoacid dehydrogenase subunit beta [Chloroflexi bacterium]|nr:alpha-ketoacid dehydrogenase subunit beta [Chloroflexota bacterium]MCC6891701.1 alpha-ketoacid dehydrogenase subunit beta [Anaerolineae bacterium]
MAVMTYREAVKRALDEEMARDENVIFFGEDVGAAGGVFKVTPGLFEKYGGVRVRDTPISENAIIGAGIGAAVTGLRPVVELMFADFAAVTLDQIINQAAKFRYMSGGQLKVPLVIRAAQGGGAGFASQHSQCVETWFMHAPGLKVVVPSNPADVLGLLKTAIRDDNPVVFLEHKVQYAEKGEVPDDEHIIPFGVANVVRAGSDVTIVATQRMVAVAVNAAEELAKEGISCEVIDPRTLVPLDLETIIASVQKTGRLMTVEEAPHAGGWGAEVATRVTDQAIWSLESPVVRVTLEGALIPFSAPLEDYVIPNKGRVVAAIHRMLDV